MLIHDKHSKKATPLKGLKYFLGSIVLLVVLIYVIYPFVLKTSTLNDRSKVACDAEKVFRGAFYSNGKTFGNGRFQSDETARSGTYSIKLPPGDSPKYGFTYELAVDPGEVFQVSVWRKTGIGNASGQLVFAGKKDDPPYNLYHATDETIKKDLKGWHLLSMRVEIPSYYHHETVSVFVFSDANGEVFFDDLTIVKLDPSDEATEAKSFVPRHLDLVIKDTNFKKIQAKREEAFAAGLIITDEESWVNAAIQETGVEGKIPVKLRLKGDWLDHLRGDKWSFRINVKTPYAWNRMTTFSVQHPSTRYYLMEWLLHQFWEREDVLTTRYDFISLSVNGDKKGIFAYEEHFSKELLEFSKRREGPIVRFSEEALWDARQRSKELGYGNNRIRQDFSKLPAADIRPFKEKKILGSETLSAQYEIAQNLLFQYQQGLKPAAEIFNLDQMAKFTAIADLFGAIHCMIWHNQRYYYNPVTSVLEPIGFDSYSGKPRRDPLVLGKAILENGEPFDYGPLSRLYAEEAFIEKYMYYLEKYSRHEYMFDFYYEIEDGLLERAKWLKKEFPEYQFDKNEIFNRVDQIRFRLLPYNEHSVNANWRKTQNAGKVLQMSNLHELPLQIVGVGKYQDWLRDTFTDPLFMPAYRLGHERIIKEREVAADVKYVFYKPFGIDTVFQTQISAFGLPENFVPKQNIFNRKELKSNEIYEVDGSDVVIKKGNYILQNDLIIPEGYQVFFAAGVNIDMQNKAKFISRSPVYMNGTNDEPIVIRSSDGSANGFTVLNAEKESKLSFVVFKNMNTLDYQGWTLTGAVTFYESDVILRNCLFENARCEDALNIIRSKFTADNITVDACFSDGFDADYCTGLLVNSEFKNTGNDGVDFSGSRIQVKSSQMTNCGDKGVSVGEESYVALDDVTVDGAVIGVASKDLSYLLVEDVTLKNCNQGFAAYQKKPEYGVSSIFVKKYQAENVKYLHTLAPRCTLEIGGNLIIGGE